MTEPGWTSVHIHYHEPLEALIRGGVRPLLAEARGLVKSWFFVRHWQAGPHLRLRLCTPPAHVPQVSALLERHVGGFLRTHPSRKVIDPEEYQKLAASLVAVERGQDEVEPLRPDNTMHHVPYRPELARYGGTPEAMRAVERHFTASSDVAAELLAGDAGSGRRTGQALAMMLIAAMVPAGAGGLAGHLGTGSRDWGGRLLFGDPEAGQNRFEQKYLRQRATLIGTVERVMRLVETGTVDRAGAAVGRWAASVTGLRDDLVALRRRGLFAPREVLIADGAADADLRSVLLFCSHMHNNRLGISLPEEAYLMYLLWRAVSEVTASAR
ncbi:thiopeptide-type bacteriocin biosynthesis protein [Couchioplanes caeruleus]|uniref:Lantibiotic dehydratase n=2 Tax=Couchioplanes caeruleus TaxID=56438 RepID=A0A1K0FS19_9ACTN|nr:thiopeptide-type bacteriocin biosynthesis protein [Couchioplanes caeruleus]OJF15585.1 Lantibiotic dehydratase [Couchioplanes caeruleus subsp. caeruleus]ROP30273.1 thiopeptide-type bacteriocin biosynthesis protein [Couchioplanes caeruleus]